MKKAVCEEEGVSPKLKILRLLILAEKCNSKKRKKKQEENLIG